MMTPTKIVQKLALQNYKHDIGKGGRYYCAPTSYGSGWEKTKLANNNEAQKEGLKCLLYEARKNDTVQEAEEKKIQRYFKKYQSKNGASERRSQSQCVNRN